MTNDQIKHMVDRFLCWRLPENFCPDDGISFKAEFNERTAHPMRHEPTGTNLFNATQAEAMVRHMLRGLPTAASTCAGCKSDKPIRVHLDGDDLCQECADKWVRAEGHAQPSSEES